MNTEDKDAAVILGICVAVNPPKGIEDSYPDKKESSASLHNCNESSEISFPPLPFYTLPVSLDPNLGILGELLPSNILHEENTFNCWNIEPHFLHILPLATTDPCESSILVFGGLNPRSILKNNPPDFSHEDFVLGSTIFQYLLQTNVWKYYGTMIEPRCYHACALLGQYVYVTGGYSLLTRHHCEMIATASTDKLNFEDKQWKKCANMITARAMHAVISYKSDLYVLGGRSSQGEILSSVELYNPDKDFWIEITSIPQPTMGLCATCTADTIWILGGITCYSSDDLSHSLLSNVYSFSPSTKRWTEEPSLPQPCAFSSCVSNDQSLLVIGGCSFSKNSKTDSLCSSPSILQLSLSAKTSKWRLVASLLYPRHATTAILHDDLIYVLAGMESNYSRASSITEVLNMRTNTSVECANLPVSITGSGSVIIKQDLSIPQCGKCGKHHSLESCNIEIDVWPKANYTVKDEYSQESIKTSSILEEDNGSYGSEYDSLDKILKKNIGTEERSENIQFRSSVEIFLNSNLADEEACLFPLKKKNPSALKWLKFFDSLSASDEELHKNVFESKPKIHLKTEVDGHSLEKVAEAEPMGDNNSPYSRDTYSDSLSVPSSVSEDITSNQESFLYIQSNLKSLPSNADFEENASDKVSSSKTTKEEIDNFYASKDTNKITLEDCFPLVLVMGGEYPKNNNKSRLILSYYCEKDTWESVGFMPEHRCHHSLVYMNDKIYVIGGFQSATSRLYENITNKVSCYNICNEMWIETDCMNYSRAYHSTVYLDSKIYVIGGRDEAGNILTSVEAYDESEKKWKACRSLPYPVLGAAAGASNDLLYVFGGITYDDENEIISTKTSIFDIHNDSWSQGSDMQAPLAFCGITVFSNSVWLFGGLKEKDGNIISSRNVVKLDLQTEIWSKITKLSVPRHAAITVSSGPKVYVIGGHSTQDKKEVSACEFLDLEKREIHMKEKVPIAVSSRAGVIITAISKSKEKI